MQAVADQVNVAARKQKTGGKMMTTGQLREQDDTEKLIQQHNGYQILKQLRCSPIPIGNQHKRISWL
jgi:hypothetical protein